MLWNCFILADGEGNRDSVGHYFSGDYVSVVISVLLLCHRLAGNVFGLITLQTQDETSLTCCFTLIFDTHIHKRSVPGPNCSSVSQTLLQMNLSLQHSRQKQALASELS